MTGIFSLSESESDAVKDSSLGIQEESALTNNSSPQTPVQSAQSKSSKSYDDDEDEWEDDKDDYPNSSVTQTAANPPQTATAPAPSSSQTTQTYTLAQVAAHATAQSCWSAVNGGVYDLTSWISRHPGGSSAIESMCGKDASADFNAQHTGQSKPENELASFKIGILK